MSRPFRVTGIGRLTRDPDVKFSQNGKAIAIFSLAQNRLDKSTNTQIPEYWDCIAFGITAEQLSKFAFKGQRLAIAGRLQRNEWQDKNGNKRIDARFVVDEFEALREDKAAPQQQAVCDEDIPF